ncbi:hypothetical protein D3C71_1294220 [compost metagenome]
MFTYARIWDFKIRRQTVHHIVRIQHGIFGYLTQSVWTIGADIGVGTNENTKVAVKSFHASNRFRSAEVE